jgi:hypothetical protein
MHALQSLNKSKLETIMAQQEKSIYVDNYNELEVSFGF